MIKTGILGVSGLVGSQYFALLKNHPWFKVHAIAASEKSAQGTYEGLTLKPPAELLDCEIIFSALPFAGSAEFESYYAKEGAAVISSSSYYRKDADIPLLIPEINKSHLEILTTQKKNRNWKGCIVSKPNCSVQSF